MTELEAEIAELRDLAENLAVGQTDRIARTHLEDAARLLDLAAHRVGLLEGP